MQKTNEQIIKLRRRPILCVTGQMSRHATSAPSCWSETARLLVRFGLVFAPWKSAWNEGKVKTPPTMPLRMVKKSERVA